MVFSSLNFLFLFLPAVLLAHTLVPMRFKNIVLLAASIFFYAWGEPVYVVLMVLNIAFSYTVGLQIESRKQKWARKRSLVFGIVINLLMLGFFKYYGFAVDTFNAVFHAELPKRTLSLPVGISFYTFQTLSYLIDVYRGEVGAQKSLINFATYITMFPQLVAGPIVKYTDIRGQLENRRVTWNNAGRGVERIVCGLAKKVLLANNLGLLYSGIQTAAQRSVLTAWLGAAAYALQIYFDFSGYSDMAIGMGKLLGFDFIENFDHPYVSKSITEFWRRWHISLSSWFRDYVYIPLGGSRTEPWKHLRNLLAVWLLTGLWHGASWNFVLWGLYHGVLLILEKTVFAPTLKKMSAAASRALTLLLVTIGWVIFSNTDLSAMTGYLGSLIGIGASGFWDKTFRFLLTNNLVLIVLAVAACLPSLKTWFIRRTSRYPVLSGVCMVALFLLVVASLIFGSYNPFLYFRF